MSYGQSQNDIHIDFGHTKLNRKKIMITIRNSKESVNLLVIT
jgi:hypothetical protein